MPGDPLHRLEFGRTSTREKEVTMMDVIGDAAAQQMPRLGLLAGGADKDAIAKKAELVREARPVEPSNAGEKPRTESDADSRLKSRNRLEDGKIIVEKYDEDGKLVRRDPPGYLPFGEFA
jgi:hypothetical protein